MNPNKPTIPEVIDRFRAYYAQPGNGAWGSLHIVMDDGNVNDHSVEFCRTWSRDQDDAEGAALAEILLRMSKTQRRKLGNIIHYGDKS